MFAQRHTLAAVLFFLGAVLDRAGAVAQPLPGTILRSEAGSAAAPHLNSWFVVTATLVAAGLGGLHALELGKITLGSRGHVPRSVLQALRLSAKHLLAVFALGALAVFASRYVILAPFHPWVGVVSGLLVVALGASMLLHRLAFTAIGHEHAASAAHTRIPFPSTLAVLLSAVALPRVVLGFFLVAAYGLGLASILIGFGMMRRDAGRSVSRATTAKGRLPAVSAGLTFLLGCLVASQGFTAAKFHLTLGFQGLPSAKLGPLFSVIGLGLILGMRHSTDADHVVAISTIVSKQRSIRGAALIGSVWGIGHTITIFIVGSLIILFGVEIPPRLGLSMEFCVALMLVLLGVLNLTGVLRKVTERYTPQHFSPALPGADASGQASFSERVLDRTTRRFGAFQFLRPLVIGLVHGLAGSAAVALLVLSTIHNPLWAIFYLLVFGAGTMVGMMCMTAAMAVPFTYAGERFAKMSRYLTYASGLASLGFGSFLVYQLGYVGNLFGSHPIWTPQ